MSDIAFQPANADPAADAVRAEVRAFLAEALKDRRPVERAESWNGYDPAFSRELGRRGWLGMTWPRRYGGHERSAAERHAVIEELLAAGAPVSAHWIAERQSGPALLKFGTEAQRSAILPRIAAGDCCFCIGMSEPDSGSDLAAVRTRAQPEAGGFRITGTKLWTTNAHRADYMILFCRTSGGTESRQAGTSQLLIDMTTPGIVVRPVIDLAGHHDFNEVFFDNVLVPADALLGSEGQGWHQVTSELAYERSGPERFLTSFTLLAEVAKLLGPDPSERAAAAIGRLCAHLVTLRTLSQSVAAMLAAGEDPQVHAALVKSLGSECEQEVSEVARLLISDDGGDDLREYRALLAHCVAMAPAYSLRGGTREILRGIIARGLGLR